MLSMQLAYDIIKRKFTETELAGIKAQLDHMKDLKKELEALRK
jgi:hypothetical protein